MDNSISDKIVLELTRREYSLLLEELKRLENSKILSLIRVLGDGEFDSGHILIN